MSKSKPKKTKPPQARKGAKRKPASPPAAGTPPSAENPPLAPDDRIATTNLSLHQLFEQQTARMLDRVDLSEEQKQSILIGISCPCCGAGGFSFTAKLRRG